LIKNVVSLQLTEQLCHYGHFVYWSLFNIHLPKCSHKVRDMSLSPV